MVRPVIHSTKHLVQFPFNGITTGTAENLIIISTVAIVNKNIASEVEEGATVKAVYVELWTQNSANDGHEIVTLVKRSNNQNGVTFAESAGLFSFAEKKNILFTHEGLTSNDGVGNPIAVMRGWFKIPKSKQRFGLGDTLVVTVSNPSSNTLNRCGIAIYKEYT